MARQVLQWYGRHGRRLPWRTRPTPYRTWVSEIMLQQTQVATVLGSYSRFLERFPDLASLAEAPEAEVLRVWEGLGYYRRARNLHAAARLAVRELGGELPADAASLRALPGIGRYTAGAILSIACGQRQPVLEGNTIRLHTRLTGLHDDIGNGRTIGKLWKFAEAILPARRAGDFNQALMDIGSAICTPLKPRCHQCPLADCCIALKTGTAGQLPFRREKMRYENRHDAAILVVRRKQVLMRQCGPGEWWSGLWDFPRVELALPRTGKKTGKNTAHPASRSGVPLAAWLFEQSGIETDLALEEPVLRHAVTRWRIHLHCFLATRCSGRLRPSSGYVWQKIAALRDLPLSATGRLIADRIAGPRP